MAGTPSLPSFASLMASQRIGTLDQSLDFEKELSFRPLDDEGILLDVDSILPESLSGEVVVPKDIVPLII